MTSVKWRLQVSLLNVRKDLYVINRLGMWPIAGYLQFAYKIKSGVDYAILPRFNSITNHLDLSGTTVRILFKDVLSAFCSCSD